MSREEARKLLGGYAAGNLTEAENRALFEAALEDQELYNELAREQPLRELLEDPAARAAVLAAFSETRVVWWRRPLVIAPALAAAAAVVVVVIAIQPRREAQKPLVAELRPPVVAPLAAPPAPMPQAAAPAAKAKEKKTRPAPEPVPAPQPAVVPEPELAAKAETQVAAEAPPAAAAATADKAFTPRDRASATPSMTFRAASHFTQGVPVSVTVLRKGNDGAYAAASGPLRAGDSLRLNLVPASSGQLTVWQPEPSGGRFVLFEGPVEARKLYVVPAQGVLQFGQPGRHEILVRLSEQPVVTVTVEFQ